MQNRRWRMCVLTCELEEGWAAWELDSQSEGLVYPWCPQSMHVCQTQPSSEGSSTQNGSVESDPKTACM